MAPALASPLTVNFWLIHMTEKTHASLAIPARDTEDGHALPPRGREWKRAKLAVLIVLILLAAGAARTVVSDLSQSRSVSAIAQQNAKVYVNVVTPKQAVGGGDPLDERPGGGPAGDEPRLHHAARGPTR